MKTAVKRFVSHPLLSGSLVMMVGSMGVNVINYIYHLVMGRLLGPVDYGTLASIYSILYIVSIVPTSTSFAIVKFISSAKDKDELGSIYYGIKNLVLYVALGTSLIVALSSSAISKFLNIGSIWPVLFVAPVLFLSLITLVNQASLQGLLKFIGVVGPNLVSSIVKLLLGVLFVFLGWSVTGAIGAVVISVLLAYFYSTRLARGLFPQHQKSNFKLMPFLRFSLPVLLQALAFTSIFTVDILLVKHFFPPYEAGLYASLSMLGKVIYFAASPITSTMFPIVSGRHARGEKYFKVFFASLGLTVLMSFSIVALYFLLPDLSIGLLYGQKYLAAKGDLVWMGLFLSFYTVAYILSNFYLSIGKTKLIILPLLTAIVQVVAIWFYHPTLHAVIMLSLGLMVFLAASFAIILGYNQLKQTG